MNQYKELSQEFIEELFLDNEKVLQYVADLKWQEGYVCRKCGHTNFCFGKTYASRRCTRCKTEESATAHTIFHNCKFPINKAFFIAYTVCGGGKEISSYEYADKLELNQMTCWKFRKRIKDRLYKHSKVKDKNPVPIHTILVTEEK